MPGKFEPKPASDTERLWLTFSPWGWECLPFFGLVLPATFAAYGMLHGYRMISLIGLIFWLPLLWLVLVTFHQMGRMRIWLSVPLLGTVQAIAILLMLRRLP
jgi:hypothetical protein